MEKVGIRELRQNLSVYLARVKEGIVFEVTDRGRPVAVLKPTAPERDSWQRLIDQGKVIPAQDPDPHFDPPKGPLGDWASKSLEEQREERL